MKNSTYHLPWPLDLVRFDSSLTTEDRLIKVFEYVKKRSGTPVTAVIDVQPDSRSILSNLPSTHIQSTSFLDIYRDPSVVIPSFSFDPDAREFTRQIKHLVNSHGMRCLFAASEGASFHVEHDREPRLKLFIAHELSMPFAEKYLQKMCSLPVDADMKDMLTRLPRTFATLKEFASASDKKAFVDSAFDELVGKVQNTLSVSGKGKAEKIYRIALEREIQVQDFQQLPFSKADFDKVFVATNVFTLTAGGYKYRFQFEATRAAARQVLNTAKKGWLTWAF